MLRLKYIATGFEVPTAIVKFYAILKNLTEKFQSIQNSIKCMHKIMPYKQYDEYCGNWDKLYNLPMSQYKRTY